MKQTWKDILKAASEVVPTLKNGFKPLQAGEQSFIDLLLPTKTSGITPFLEGRKDSGKITQDEYNQILQNGFVDAWKNAKLNSINKSTINNENVLGTNTYSNILNTPEYQKISDFVSNYPGTRIDNSYLQLLANNSNDIDTLKRIIAASVSETGMGKNAYSNPNNPSREQLKNSNYWGYYVGGNRAYDPTREEMATIIAKAFGPNGAYSNLNSDTINKYTGGDRSSNWANIYNWAMNQMK